MWSRKCIKIQTLHASSFNNNNKIDYNIYIITDDLKSDSDKSYKHSKN